MSDRDFIPYYYGMNYEAPRGDPGAFPSQGLGLLAGRAMRQSVVGGADAGLWLENLAGVPLEPARMMLEWGGESRKGYEEFDLKGVRTGLWRKEEDVGPNSGFPYEPASGFGPLREDWQNAPMEFINMWKERLLGGAQRTGERILGDRSRVIDESSAADILDAVGVAATPGMFGSKPSLSVASAMGRTPKNMKPIAELSQAELSKLSPSQRADHLFRTFPEEGIREAYLGADEAGRAAMRSRIESGQTAVKGDLINKVQNRFQTAYDVAREKAGGGSWVDIAVLRDNLGLSQEKMAGILRRATKEGHALMDLGEPSVVNEHLKGGMVDGNLLVKLEPSFFDNIGSYIKQDVRKSLKQMEVDEIEKELLR